MITTLATTTVYKILLTTTKTTTIIHLLTLDLADLVAMEFHFLNQPVRILRVIVCPALPRIMAELPVIKMVMEIKEQRVIRRHIPTKMMVKLVLLPITLKPFVIMTLKGKPMGLMRVPNIRSLIQVIYTQKHITVAQVVNEANIILVQVALAVVRAAAVVVVLLTAEQILMARMVMVESGK